MIATPRFAALAALMSLGGMVVAGEPIDRERVKRDSRVDDEPEPRSTTPRAKPAALADMAALEAAQQRRAVRALKRAKYHEAKRSATANADSGNADGGK